MKPSKYHHLIRHSWIALVAFFTLIPTISWGYHANIKDALTLPTLTMTLIGQITGIIGAQLFGAYTYAKYSLAKPRETLRRA